MNITSREQADAIMAELEKEKFAVTDVKKGNVIKRLHSRLSPVPYSRKHPRY